MIFRSSGDLPGTSVALVPWLWVELVRTCALPELDRVLGRTSSRPSGDTMFSVNFTSAWCVLSSLQSRTSSQISFGRRGVPDEPTRSKGLVLFACPLCCPPSPGET